MTNCEKLKENYEDALFALLMDEVAQQEGKQVLDLNRQLQSDPAAAVPEDIQRHCEEIIRNTFIRKQRRKKFRKVLKAFVIAAVVGALMFTAVFATLEKFRVSTLNAIITVVDKGTDIIFHNSSTPSKTPLEKGAEIELQLPDPRNNVHEYAVVLKLPPECTEIDSDWTWVNMPKGYLTLENQTNSTINISVTPYAASAIFSFDTEDCDKRIVTVGKHTAELYTKTEAGLNKRHMYMPSDFDIWSNQKIIWIDEEHQCIVHIVGVNITEETILCVANSISWDGFSCEYKNCESP